MSERLLTNLHGLAATVYLAALIHLGLYFRRFRGRPAGPIPVLSHIMAASALVVSGLAWIVYPAYRRDIKPRLALSSLRWTANLFDVKEHWGFYALLISLAIWGWIQIQRRLEPEAQRRLNPAGLVWLNALLAALAGGLGLLVSTYRDF